MRIDHVVYVAEQAVRQWERHLPAREAAEDAWFILFSLRARVDLLPDSVHEDFEDLWNAYGGLAPAKVTKPMVREFLDGLCDADFLRLERMTRAFLTTTTWVAADLPA